MCTHHPLEKQKDHPYGVKRFNPDLGRWEVFTWVDAAWTGPYPSVAHDSTYLAVSYDETWADPIDFQTR